MNLLKHVEATEVKVREVEVYTCKTVNVREVEEEGAVPSLVAVSQALQSPVGTNAMLASVHTDQLL